MYRFYQLVTFLLVFNISAAQEVKSNVQLDEKQEIGYDAFGEKISATNSISSKMMYNKYQNLESIDSIQTKFSATVLDVCKVKGCWMKLELDKGEEAMVKFKDYSFFMPLDIKGKEVVVDGNAFVNNISVEEQKHYAKDSGKQQEEIDRITTPKKTYSFIAEGVLIKK
ncbi:DUF4920 domain-containing protein [Kriegella sp. EG-1]|nr:DUF4920 domain-containing protein [Flavobacteriaceae bacterium EG-1]